MRTSGDEATLRGSLRPRGPIQLALTTRNDRGATVVGVSGELDVLTASKLTTRLDDVFRKRRGDVVIDLSDAGFIDSLGLHALLSAQRRLMRQGRSLIVICGDGPVRRAIALARLTEALGVVSSFVEYQLLAQDRRAS
jgi:anti-sigma B factor antagonist